MPQTAVRSPALRCAMAGVVAVLLIAVTAFVFTSHFVPVMVSKTPFNMTGVEMAPRTIVTTQRYMKLFFSHVAYGTSGKYYQSEEKLNYNVFVDGFDIYGNLTDYTKPLGRSMLGAYALAIVATVCGGLATILILMTFQASQSRCIDGVRLTLTFLAWVTSLVAMCLVVTTYNNGDTKKARALMVIGGNNDLKLSTGFAFICVGFAGYLITFLVDLIASCCISDQCVCSCGWGSRDAWSSADSASASQMERQDSKYSYMRHDGRY